METRSASDVAQLPQNMVTVRRKAFPSKRKSPLQKLRMNWGCLKRVNADAADVPSVARLLR